MDGLIRQRAQLFEGVADEDRVAPHRLPLVTTANATAKVKRR
jgi:hypothetical protein